MSNPRIISGTARGTRLQSVPGDSTRPITDRVKESLFNIIGADIQDAVMLDLFGGTGSVGIEALSRGAAFVRFIDNNHSAVSTIKANLERTHMKDKAEVKLMDAFAHLRQMPDRDFDYIYVAPPQYKDLWLRALNEIDANIGWVNADTWVIVQIHPVELKEVSYNHLKEFDRRQYGSTVLIFYQIADVA
jgi:16S rRNA (guanine(966)-N(2))-methyltransferase RsmD